MLLWHPPKQIKFVICPHSRQCCQAVGHTEKCGNRTNIPDVLIAEGECSQRREIGFFDQTWLCCNLQCKIQHRTLTRVNLGATIIHCQLICQARIFAVNTHQCAVRHHTILAIIGGAGHHDNHFPFGFTEPALFFHQGIMVSKKGPELVWPVGQHSEYIRDKAGLLLHSQNARTHMSFGYGIHYCLGFQLAKLEGGIVLRQLTQRFPSLRLASDFTPRFHRNISFRVPSEVMVDWNRSA